MRKIRREILYGIIALIAVFWILAAMPLTGENSSKGGAPYYIYGYVYDIDGVTPLSNNPLTITDVTIGQSKIVTTNGDGYYQYDISVWDYGNGDTIKVNATDGTYYGDNTTTVDTSLVGSECNVTLQLAGFSFNLKPGWSFITLPLNTSLERAGDLAKAVGVNCTHVGRWNATSQLFESHRKSTDVNNFTIDDGVGYFVYVTNNTVFTVNGNEITNITMSLKQGWNSIGRFNSTSTNAKTLASNITNCTSIVYWNTTLGRFITHPKGEDISNFTVERGKGCLIYVTSNEEWINE